MSKKHSKNLNNMDIFNVLIGKCSIQNKAKFEISNQNMLFI